MLSIDITPQKTVEIPYKNRTDVDICIYIYVYIYNLQQYLIANSTIHQLLGVGFVGYPANPKNQAWWDSPWIHNLPKDAPPRETVFPLSDRKQGRVGQGNPRPPTISSRLCNAMVHWDAFSPQSFLASFNWKWTQGVRRSFFGKSLQDMLHNWMERIKAWWVVPAPRRLTFRPIWVNEKNCTNWIFPAWNIIE